jgi:hypothetical protein
MVVDVRTPEEIDCLLAEAQKELALLDSRRTTVLGHMESLRQERDSIAVQRPQTAVGNLSACLTSQSPSQDKIALFMSLFRGRLDVYPRRFESKRTGKSGYQPACSNEWIRGRCGKPQVKCVNCRHREFEPLTDEVIRNHLRGCDPMERSERDFTIGVYPLLPDETCWFIAADFDKASWTEDASAFLRTCESNGVPAALERSRSGNGGHVWIFISEAIERVEGSEDLSSEVIEEMTQASSWFR